MDKVKVLTITTSGLIKKEGISTVILDYYSCFDKDRFQLDIVAAGEYGQKLIEEFQNIGVNIRYLPSRKNDLLNYIKAFVKLLKKEHYDVLYIHGSSALMAIELEIAKVLGIKKRIAHSHNTTCDHKKADRVLRPLFYRSFTRALACGQDAGRWLYGSREFEIIRNGRDIATYKFNEAKRDAVRRQLMLNEDTVAIGHVGNFNKQKNQKFLIDVLEQIVLNNDNVKLYLMGDGEKKDEVERKVQQKGLQNYVVFTGSIQNVPDMLQAMDVMLLPSLHEGLPLVVIEWQIAGLPCILSDCITTECAYTDLVKFLSLNECNKWADEAISAIKGNRGKRSVQCIELTKRNGYSLQDNAAHLESFFL